MCDRILIIKLTSLYVYLYNCIKSFSTESADIFGSFLQPGKGFNLVEIITKKNEIYSVIW